MKKKTPRNTYYYYLLLLYFTYFNKIIIFSYYSFLFFLFSLFSLQAKQKLLRIIEIIACIITIFLTSQHEFNLEFLLIINFLQNRLQILIYKELCALKNEYDSIQKNKKNYIYLTKILLSSYATFQYLSIFQIIKNK